MVWSQMLGLWSLVCRSPLDGSSTTQRPSPPPPISQRNNQNTSHPSRILFLTDSVLSSTPEHIFEAVPNHVCVKQKEYQLTNIDKYSSQFGHTDVVILSMGINDLSRAMVIMRGLCSILRLPNFYNTVGNIRGVSLF